MSNETKRAPRALETYPVSLQQAAAALWGGNFWEREKVNSEARPASGRSRSSA
jgi:hypothetical protein